MRTLTPLSVILATLFVSSTASAAITWEQGKTKVNNGDTVVYQEACYIAQNNPGVWETPSAASSWFWQQTTCDGTTTPPVTPEPPVKPEPPIDPEPPVNPEPPVTPPAGDVIVWQPGQTKVSNGDIVSFNNQCFEAKNNPGLWESPSANSWFWTPVDCPSGPVEPPVEPPIKPEPPITPPPIEPPVTPPGEMTIIPDGNGGFLMSRSELSNVETTLTNTPLFALVRSDIETADNAIVEAVAPNLATNPENVQRAEMIVDEVTWNYLFPLRNEAYTYTRFLQSIAKFPAFCRTYTDGRNSDEICKRSLATMFAHFIQETGANAPNWEASKGVPVWRQGLWYLREMGNTETSQNGAYSACGSWQGEAWPCAPGKSYFGRGAKQLSWNYNYGAFSEAMFGDKHVLLQNPALVADTWLNLASAVFFYVYPQPPKPSMLHVIDGTWQPNAADKAAGLELGFGVTIQIINGAFECGKGAEDYRAQNRINYYRKIAELLNLDITGETLGCANMKPFNTDGAGALEITWDKDWGYDANNPGGATFACKLVPYQYAYSALRQGDYENCVKHFFNVTTFDDNGEIIPAGK